MKYELPEGILKKHDAKEYRLQVACIDYLKGQRRIKNKTYPIIRPFPQLWKGGEQRFMHCYAGRDAEDGFFLKQMGVRAGIYDIMLWWEAGIHFVDLKWNTGLSHMQRQFSLDMKSIGIKTATANSVAQFRDILIGFGLICENLLVTEPQISLEQKQANYLEMMKPLE